MQDAENEASAFRRRFVHLRQRRHADESEGIRVGGVDYITKPIVGAEVLARVRTHLRLKRAYDGSPNFRRNGSEAGQRSAKPDAQPGGPSGGTFPGLHLQVLKAGGDFYDVIPTGENVVDYLVQMRADMTLRLLLDSIPQGAGRGIRRPAEPPIEIVRAINSSLRHILPRGAFFTLIYARVNQQPGASRW